MLQRSIYVDGYDIGAVDESFRSFELAGTDDIAGDGYAYGDDAAFDGIERRDPGAAKTTA